MDATCLLIEHFVEVWFASKKYYNIFIFCYLNHFSKQHEMWRKADFEEQYYELVWEKWKQLM